MANISSAGAAQKVYILHKKPSLSGTLCAKPRAPESRLRRLKPTVRAKAVYSYGSGQARLMSATPPKAAPKADIPGSPSRANTRHQAHPDGGLFVVVHLGQCDSALAR